MDHKAQLFFVGVLLPLNNGTANVNRQNTSIVGLLPSILSPIISTLIVNNYL